MKRSTTGAAIALPAVAAMVAAVLAPTPQATADPATPAVAAPASAPALFEVATTRDLPTTGAEAVNGTRRLVTLDTSLLPRPGTSRDLAVSLDARSPMTARVDKVVTTDGYTSWTGPVLGTMGSFSLVEADGVFRGQVATADGITSISTAGGDKYWLTNLAPFPAPTEDDRYFPEGDDADGADGAGVAPAADAASAAPRSAVTERAGKKGKKKGKKGKGGKAKVTVLFGYTKQAEAVAGGKAAIKAAAAFAVADTNQALTNSGAKVKVKLKGIARTKSEESTSMAKDIRKLEKPRDGKFDNLLRARARKGADIVHVFLVGIDTGLCGIGAQVESPRRAYPNYGQSMSGLDCLDNKTVAHELGHNMGADHNNYPGVTHYSDQKYAYGYVDLVNRFTTVMSYSATCYDAGFDCLRAPYYSSTKALFYGLPVGTKKQNNAKALTKVAPRVARYRR
jgi:hypothetical protein